MYFDIPGEWTKDDVDVLLADLIKKRLVADAHSAGLTDAINAVKDDYIRWMLRDRGIKEGDECILVHEEGPSERGTYRGCHYGHMAMQLFNKRGHQHKGITHVSFELAEIMEKCPKKGKKERTA